MGSSHTQGGVMVTLANPALESVATETLDAATARKLAAAIVAKDATVWGQDAATEAAKRLGWLDCTTVSRPLVPAIAELRLQLQSRGIDRVVLAGMGGSSLAPE